MHKWFLLSIVLIVTTSAFESKTKYHNSIYTDTIPQKIDTVVADVKIENVEFSTDSLVFVKVEIEPSVNQKLWVRHLQKYLPDYIEKAAKQNMPSGTYTVQVKFLVEKNGDVTDIQALNDPGYGLKNFAVKIVETGPKWDPGIQNGRIVRAYHIQPITFVIQ